MAPSEAAEMPLPKEDTTPPVTNTYLVMGTLMRESAMITEDGSPPEATPAGSARSRAAAAAMDSSNTACPDSTGCGDAKFRRLLLFGAFDRHNFGDLLLAHCAAARYRRRAVVFTGLTARDLTAFGGHRVEPLADVLGALGEDAVDFVHVGGEVLTTTAWEAAVMLQTPADAAAAIATYDRDPEARRDWAAATLRSKRLVPYVVDRALLPSGSVVHFDAVGGVALETLAPDERAEVFHALKSATSVSVRDRRTADAVREAGIRADLVPDPAAATAALLGDAIAARNRTGEMAALYARMPDWIAVQLSADHGDDATLDRLAQALHECAMYRDCGVVLFRAALAPWHDDRDTLERLSRRLAGRPVAILESAHLLDICALLAGARAYIGTSLHGWIVAESFGAAAHCLVRSPRDKAASYLDTWSPTPRKWRTLGDADLLPLPATAGD